MVIWSLQVAIRGTVSLTAYKTQLKNARHRLNEAPRRRILQMVQPLSKVRTTISRKAVAAGDRVNRQFVAERPDQLWVADFTYVSTWRGFVYVAFIIDVFAGYIVGWRVSSSMETTFVLERIMHTPRR